jgi:hypothetical protein
MTDQATEYTTATGERTWTFDQFVQYGIDAGTPLTNGMPWAFTFHGHPVTHENDQCYVVSDGTAHGLRFTPDNVLTVNPDGSISMLRAEARAA